MSRPTREQVDECMRMAAEETFGADDPTVYMSVLADEVRALREQLLDLRETAVAFAYIAVTSDWTLRSTTTLENLRLELNRCQPPNAVDVKPGFRT